MVQTVRDQVYSELQGSLHALRSELSATKEQLKEVQGQVRAPHPPPHAVRAAALQAGT